MSDVGDFIFGDDEQSGMLNTGQFKPEKYNANKSAFYNDQQAAANQQKLSGLADKYGNMKAPTVGQGQVNQMKGVQGKAIKGQSNLVGPASQMNVKGQQMQAGQVGQAQQAGDLNASEQFRDAQGQLLGNLQQQAAGQGPSLAEGQLRRAQESNLKNQMAAAAAGGGSSALAKRNLASGAAESNQMVAADAAQMRIQEQLNAQQQLAGLSGQARGQDIDQANAQANINLANAAQSNQFALQQAQLDQGASQFNAGQMNDMAMQQATQNMAAQNQFKMAQFDAKNQMGLANLGYQNQMQMANLQNLQQAGMSNQAALNQFLASNQQAQLQQNQMNMQGAMGFNQMGLNAQQQNMANQQAYEQLMAQQQMGMNQQQMQAYYQTGQNKSGLLSGLAGGVMAGASMSDKQSKESIDRGERSLQELLNSYQSKGGGGQDDGVIIFGKKPGMQTSDKHAKDISDNEMLNNYLKTAQQKNAQPQQSFVPGLMNGGNDSLGKLAGGITAMEKSRGDKNKKSMEQKAQPSGDDGVIIFGRGQQNQQPQFNPQPDPPGFNPQPDPPGFNPQPDPPGVSVPLYSVPLYSNNTMSSSPGDAKSNIGAGNGSIVGFLQSLQGSSGGGMNSAAGGMGSYGKGNDMSQMMAMYPNQQTGNSTPMQQGMAAQSYGGKSMRMSDERNKKDVAPTEIEGKIQKMVDNLQAYDYNYKHPEMPGRGFGRHTSVMAQDLEKSDLGRTAVQETPQGKMVDYGKMGAINLAGLAMVNEKQQKLEELLAKMATSKKGS